MFFVHHLTAATGNYFPLNYCFPSQFTFFSHQVIEQPDRLTLMEFEYLDSECQGKAIRSSTLLNVSSHSETFPFVEISTKQDLPGGLLTISPWRNLESDCDVPPRSVHFQSGCSMSTMYSCDFLSDEEVQFFIRSYDSSDPYCLQPSSSFTSKTYSPTSCDSQSEVYYDCRKPSFQGSSISRSRSVQKHESHLLTEDYSLEIDVLLEFAQTRKSTYLQSVWDLNNPSTFCSWDGIGCDSLGHVISISVYGMELGGMIPSSLGHLTRLGDLSIPANSLTGSIPSSLGNLTNLNSINLDSNQLNGSIPMSLGNLTILESFVLSWNKFTGSIPSSLGNLNSSQYFDISGNQLTGSIPSSLGNLIHLGFLYLNSNQLTGSIPSSLGNLTNLQRLSLFLNQLTGSIPSSLGNLTNLGFLYLYSNQLTGSIPSSLGDLINLKSFDISSNQLTGSIPSSLGNLIHLYFLYLNSNQLTGSIPSSLGNSVYLRNLNLYSNQLTGSIPSSLGNLILLRSLDFNSNHLNGSIPSSLGNPISLRSLYFNVNQLTGSIPSSLGNLINLKFIYLFSNQLTGSIPSSLGDLTNLLSFDLHSNQLTGSIPSSLGNLVNLNYLYLPSNQLNGSIPSSLGALTNLVYLGLTSNQLTGTLSSSLGGLISVLSLEISQNLLTGTIPTSFGLVQKALYIYMQDNRLQGSIPATLTMIPGLRNLYLYNNNFTSLPESSFSNLLDFRVQGNPNLRGVVAQNISEIGLVTFHLGTTQLTCYSPQLLVPDQDFFNTLPLCYDDNELVLYDLEKSLNIRDTLSTVVNDIQGEWNTDHPFDSSNYPFDSPPYKFAGSIEVPGAYQFQVNIDRHSMVSGYGFLSFPFSSIDNHQYYISDCLDSSTYTETITVENPNTLDFLFQTSLGNCPTSSWGVRFTYLAKAHIPNIGWDFTIDPQTNQWRAASDYCTWYGITCQNFSHRITSIDLPGYNLRGSLPSSIGLLTTLETLDLSSNLMSSTLPNSLYDLSNLVSLDFSRNSLSGSLRDVFDNQSFPTLTKVDLSVNNLQGTLPYSLLQLPRIESISLSSNQLTGFLRDFPSPNGALYSVLLDSNQFEGSIEGLCAFWSANPSLSLSLTHNSDLTCFEPCLQNKPSSQFLVDSSLMYCAPTSYPTSQPTSPTSMPTSTPNLRVGVTQSQVSLSVPGLIGGSVGGFLLLVSLFGLGFYYVRSYQSPTERARKAKLSTLPVHSAILMADQPVKLNQAQSLLEVLKADEKYRTFVDLDYDGRTAFDCALSCLKADPSYPISSEFLSELLLMSLSPSDPKIGSSFDDWLRAVQSTHGVVVEAVILVLDRERGRVKELAFAKDSTGRVCRDLASSQCRKEINTRLFLGGRFDVVNVSPVHKSATSMLMLCMDRLNEMEPELLDEDEEDGNDCDGDGDVGGVDEDGSPAYQMIKLKPKVIMKPQSSSTRVALKFMMNQDQFEREVKIRAEGGFDTKYILGIQRSYSPLSDMLFYMDSVSKGFGTEYPYCILMEAANGDLDRMISDHNFAGEDFGEVRRIMNGLYHAVDHLHSKGYIHGDLKPKNIVLTDTSFKLIDLDASVRIGDFAGVKYSSAYMPPEMFYRRESQICVRVPGLSSLPEEELVRASPAFDIWSLGAILYLLSTKLTLFHSTTEDNLNDQDDLEKAMNWTEEVKMKKLANVLEPLARNMISQILASDPLKRPSISRLLVHPFLSGKQVVRMAGQEAEFDVFLSYRVWSDKLHVAHLYELLTAQGLKVWWDKIELKDGKNWEEGFCNGLVNSRIFVPLFSKSGLSNFSKLDTSQCACDNVLLEHRLALELSGMGLLEGIFPLVLGDEVPGSEPTQMKIVWGEGGWIPKCQDICVDSVEANTCLHLSNQALGTPLHPNRTVLSVMDEMKKMQGALIDGDYERMMSEAAGRIKALCDSKKQSQSQTRSESSSSALDELRSKVHQRLLSNANQFQGMQEEFENLINSVFSW